MNLVNNSLSLVPYVRKCSTIEKSHIYVQKNLKARIQRLIEDSFKAQRLDYKHFRKYGMGDIVVLVGTSTAGKTSIIKALQQLELDRLEDGGDLRIDAIELKFMTKYNPKEIEILKKVIKNPLDIPKAVGSEERSWKAEITSEEKIQAEEAIQKIKTTGDAFSFKEKAELQNLFQNRESEMFDDAFEHCRSGKNVIFDVLNIDSFARHVLMRKFDGPMRVVLTYCPFHVLSSRMEKRNREAVESGELRNQRIGEFPLIQFSEIYTQKEKKQIAFERLTRKQVTQAFNENFDKGIEFNRETARPEGGTFLTEKEILNEKAKSLADLLTNLGFKEGLDEVEVAPKNEQFYHLFIDSSKLRPEEAAKIIHRGTYQRY